MSSSLPQPRWRRLYPFESHFADVSGMQMHYVDEGPPDAPPLLFVHGNPTWSFLWRNLIIGLRSEYRCIAVDHIGCGLSEKPNADAYEFRLDRRIRDLEDLIVQLDLHATALVAHDWGGAIGLGAVARQASRFSRIALFNTAAFRSRRIPLRIAACRIPWLGRFAVQGLNAFARAATWMAVEDRRNLSADARAGLLAPYATWSSRRAIDRFVHDIPLHPRHPSYATLVDIESSLPDRATMPQCLIWGMRDWCFSPWFLERFQAAWPHATTHAIDDAGHYVTEDAPAECLDALRTFVEESGHR